MAGKTAQDKASDKNAAANKAAAEKDKTSTAGSGDSKAASSPNKADAKSANSTTGKSDAKDSNASSASSSSANASATVNLTTQQKTVIKNTVINNKSAPRVTKINFNISVGTVVPTTVHFAPLPASIVEIHPAWRGYDYVVYEEQVIIIEPHSHKIVEIIVVS